MVTTNAKTLLGLVTWALLSGAALPAHAQVERHRTVAQVQVQAAEHAFRAGRYDEALRRLRAGFDLDPRPEYLISFAQIYQAMGKPHEALAQCERYLGGAHDARLTPAVRRMEATLRREAERLDAAEQKEAAVAAKDDANAEPEAAAADGSARPAATAPTTAGGEAPLPATTPAMAPLVRVPEPAPAISLAATAPASRPALALTATRAPPPAKRRSKSAIAVWATVATVTAAAALAIGLGVGLTRSNDLPRSTYGVVPFHSP